MTMNCDLAAELLPWLLNGTLEAGERRELLMASPRNWPD